MEIKNIRETVLFSDNSTNINSCLEAAVKAEANLLGANLVEANLWGANLVGANLRGANLRGANLLGANLLGANLVGANLLGANLLGAYLEKANLVGANLLGANLWEANLAGANLVGAKYNVTQVLLANWREVSPEVCAYLMRLDASALPNGTELMDNWAAGGKCPLQQSNGVDRVALFQQETKHWALAKTLPQITLWELWVMLATEKQVKISK